MDFSTGNPGLWVPVIYLCASAVTGIVWVVVVSFIKRKGK